MDMIEVRTADLIGPALDWAVASLINGEPAFFDAFGARMLGRRITTEIINGNINPSIDWAQCGPLIEKYRLRLVPCDAGYFSYTDDMPFEEVGETALIAVCRAIVAFKLGSTVQVPAELLPKVDS